MTASTDPGPDTVDEHPRPPRRWPQRAGYLGALTLLGVLLAVSSQSEAPVSGDRVGRRLELVELIAQQQQRTAALAAEASALEGEIADVTTTLGAGSTVPDELQGEVDEVGLRAGTIPVTGPGLSVTLRDSSLPLEQAQGAEVNDLVIHEQDLQAVVNALWAGGAEAMTVNGQRLLTTSAIRCVGNILLLHGRVHPPPYQIAAIGGAEDLRSALDRDPAVEVFREAAERFSLGFEVAAVEALDMPAYDGLPAVDVAVPAA